MALSDFENHNFLCVFHALSLTLIYIDPQQLQFQLTASSSDGKLHMGGGAEI